MNLDIDSLLTGIALGLIVASVVAIAVMHWYVS